MGLGQAMFTIIAMLLLTMISTKVNSSIMRSQDTSQNSKFGLAAISLATSKIEEASRLAYDDVTVDTAVSSVSGFTAASKLGPETGETSESMYNDIDDYNGYSLKDTTQLSAVFYLNIKVNYVSPTNLDGVSSTQEWNKKISVTVTSPSMTDTIRYSSIFSYWVFR